MMGTGTFAEPTLEHLLQGPDPVVGVFTQPDRETGVKRGSTRQVGRGMKEIAAEKNVPVFQPESINSPEGVALLKDLNPDLLVVAAYGQILSKEVLGLPSIGAINVHASLLPKYRGAAPIAWAIYHGEAETGVTIIRMSVGLDAGNMLAQKSVLIQPMETAGELEARLAPIGAQMALDVIAQMKQGPVVGTPQDKALVTKAPKLKKEDGLIDWNRPAEAVARQIQAMQPWPTAYTFLHREGKEPMRVMIARCVLTEGHGEPSTLFSPDGKKLVVHCSPGALEILELQPAGKKKMNPSDFLRGHPIQKTDRFGCQDLFAA
ncbi:methionyl-tRNA formyltransferase [Telmatocola sphagniphila]|uniref:Methionyl-tRNA formyltransferase n=2 Tax=Telmatocola sphagniphila TaxID=1123043 RepID=A0A8E6EXJ0_9BACT|nr:methionyl-tRNA formyltransferase [Telmatocola sphagniphila]